MKTRKLALFKKTKNLIIRPFELYDHENWAQAHSSMRAPQNEWDETNWVDSELTLAKFKKFVKTYSQLKIQDKFYNFGIFRQDDGVLVGVVSLMDISRGVFQNAYLGYRIFNNYWGRSYGTEACEAALILAFKDLKLHRVEAGIAASNKRSLRLAKTIGLRKEGISPRRLFVNKKWVDLVIYAATAEDYGYKYKFPQS